MLRTKGIVFNRLVDALTSFQRALSAVHAVCASLRAHCALSVRSRTGPAFTRTLAWPASLGCCRLSWCVKSSLTFGHSVVCAPRASTRAAALTDMAQSLRLLYDAASFVDKTADAGSLAGAEIGASVLR